MGGPQDFAHLHLAALQNSPLENGQADLALSSASIKLAFTITSLCDFALVKMTDSLSVSFVLHLDLSGSPDILSCSAILD